MKPTSDPNLLLLLERSEAVKKLLLFFIMGLFVMPVISQVYLPYRSQIAMLISMRDAMAPYNSQIEESPGVFSFSEELELVITLSLLKQAIEAGKVEIGKAGALGIYPAMSDSEEEKRKILIGAIEQYTTVFIDRIGTK